MLPPGYDDTAVSKLAEQPDLRDSAPSLHVIQIDRRIGSLPDAFGKAFAPVSGPPRPVDRTGVD